MSNNNKLAYRVDEATAASGICKTKLYALIGSGDLRTVKIGRARLILRESLEALLQTAGAA